MKNIRFETEKDPFIVYGLIIAPTVLVTVFSALAYFEIHNWFNKFPVQFQIGAPILFWTYSYLVFNYTYYTFTEHKLIVRFAGLRRTIKIDNIAEIKRNSMEYRLYGLSMKTAMTIKLKKGIGLTISPLEKDKFISELELRTQ